MVILRIFVLLALIITFAHSEDTSQISSDGDIVDCIDKMNHPAFHHHLLKNHKIQESPSEFPTITESYKKSKWRTKKAHVSPSQYPERTIPVRRDGVTLTGRIEPDSASSTRGHEYGIIATKSPSKLYGAKAIINLWDPTIEEGTEEMSISQIWISNGGYSTNDVNTIEIGWQVFPTFYLDNKPRLFIFWTNDTYKSGCYNLQCPGFIQTSSSIVLGGAISPISSFGGSQFEITVLVWKDRKQGNWWLSLGSLLVGYWPSELFTELADHASMVEYGGEITNSITFGRHTTTEMGSGHFPYEDVGKTSYFRNMEVVDNNNSLKPVQDLKKKSTNPKYYDIKNMYNDEWGTHIFYGGLGFRSTHSGTVFSGLNSIVISFLFTIFFII